MNELLLPTFDDVQAAAQQMAGHAHRSSVITSRTVKGELGAQLFFKCEKLQRTGAFKFLGAFNALSKFNDGQRKAGVVTFSSGNHAQAVALSARLLGIPATIVMPHDAPAAKVAATRGYGGNVVIYDRYKQDREQIGRDLAGKQGFTLIPPYDHPDAIADQETAAKELFDEIGALDAFFVPLGGGGMRFAAQRMKLVIEPPWIRGSPAAEVPLPGQAHWRACQRRQCRHQSAVQPARQLTVDRSSPRLSPAPLSRPITV